MTTPKNAHGNVDRILKTKLEQIKEDAPQAEHEAMQNKRQIRGKNKDPLLSSLNVINQVEHDEKNKFDQIEIASNESSPLNE